MTMERATASRTALVVGAAAGSIDDATAVLRRFGFGRPDAVPAIADAMQKIRVANYDLLIVPLDTMSPQDLAAFERELRRGRSTFVIGTAPVADPDLILRAMRGGVHEFLVSPPPAFELANAVDRLMRRLPPAQSEREVIAVYSAKGGVGTTTIAINLAHAIARNRLDARVAIADMDPAASDLRVFLNLGNAYDVSDVAAKLDRLDADLIDSLLTPIPAGIWALPGPDDPELADQIDSSTTAAIIDRLRAHFAFTILDCEHHLSERTLAAMDAADRIVLVTQLNIAALKSTQKTLGICRRLGYRDEKLAVVINRRQDGDLLRERDAADVLTREVFFSLPNDYQLTSAALTQGIPIAEVDVNADLSREFSKLAAKLVGAPADDTTDRGGANTTGSKLGRLLGGLRRRA
jgi:pilus assembly protein CpaE